MNTYSKYVHPTEGPEVVKRGFSWPGFFFGFIWAFVKKLWVLGAVLLAAHVAVPVLEDRYAHGLDLPFGLLNLVIGLIVGVNGNAWRRRTLERLGYEQREWVEAKTPEEALAALTNELHD